MPSLNEIQSRAEQLNDMFNSSVEWAEKYIENESKRNTLVRAIQPASREVRRVMQASRKRPSVAIFGQSQVGKSYLVQNLLKNTDNSGLEIVHPGRPEVLDFITDINPDGGRESTGIVTRFTTEQSTSSRPNEFPFQVELFGILDVASIICLSYIKNFKAHESQLDVERINEIIEEAKQSSSSTILNSTFSADDAYHFWGFFRRQFRDKIIYDRLKHIDIPSILAYCLPRLNPQSQTKLLSIFWGENVFFSGLCTTLLETLSKLDYAQVAYVGTDALQPKESSIIDVETKRSIYNDSRNSAINIFLSNESVKEISRGHFACIVKELTLNIPPIEEDNEMQSFLRYTDILDFPGWKSDAAAIEEVFESQTNEEKLALYIRGMVSYLFDNYNENLGVSSLVICMGSTPPEVRDLPDVVQRWINIYVGDDVSKRNDWSTSVIESLEGLGHDDIPSSLSPLMFAMTKFNVEMDGKAGDIVGNPSSHDGKWSARFGSNFSEFYSSNTLDRWTENWDGQGQSFKFLFPIRDPFYSQSFFDGKSGAGGLDKWRETKIKEGKEQIMEDMRNSFCDSPVTKEFIHNPEEVWAELQSPNGSGIQYLLKYLKPASHTSGMEKQLTEILNKQQDILTDNLSPYRITGDITEDLKQARKLGNMASASIFSLSQQNGILSHMLNELVWKEEDVWNSLYRWRVLDVGQGKNTNEEEETVQLTAKLNTVITYLRDVIGVRDLENQEEIRLKLEEHYGCQGEELDEIIRETFGIGLSEIIQTEVEDEPSDLDKYLQHVLTQWSNSLIELSNAFIEQNANQIPANKQRVLQGIIHELLRSQARCRLKEEMSNAIRAVYTEQVNQEAFHFISSTLASILNRYVFTLGYAYIKNEDLPVVQDRKIFSTDIMLPEIEEEDVGMLSNPWSIYVSQLTMAAKSFYIANVEHRYSTTENQDLESNEKLDAILSSLENANLV